MLVKEAYDVWDVLLTSEGGMPGGGLLPHVGYAYGGIKLHNYLKDRYKKKVLDELNNTIFKDSDRLKKLLL